MTKLDLDYKCPPHLCPGCYGWGFPITVFDGRLVLGTNHVCPLCNGTGKPADTSAA